MSYKKDIRYIFKRLRASYKFIHDLLQDIEKLPLDDELREMKAIAIATQLRILLFDSNKCKSILSQLGIKDKLFFMPLCANGQIDSASNLVSSYLLVSCQITNNDLYVCYKKPDSFSHNLNVFFDYWWKEIVVDAKGEHPVRLDREQIVRTLCDKEGGAHLDPNFSDEYYMVNYNFGFKLVKDDGEVRELKNNVFAETTIAIAYELLDAISVFFYNVKGRPLEIENTPYSIISISYSNENGSCSRRFFLNMRNNLTEASRWAFDYYNKASYSIYRLRGYKYSREDGSFFSFLTVDEKTEQRIIVLRSDEKDIYEVIVEVPKGYSMINHNNDSLVGEVRSLKEFMIELSQGDPTCFDEFLAKQVLHN